jgi:hypothetical protein
VGVWAEAGNERPWVRGNVGVVKAPSAGRISKKRPLEAIICEFELIKSRLVSSKRLQAVKSDGLLGLQNYFHIFAPVFSTEFAEPARAIGEGRDGFDHRLHVDDAAGN